MSFSLAAQDNQQADPIKERINQLLDSVWQLKRTNPEKGLALLEQIEAMNSTADEKHKEDRVWYYYGLLYRYTNKFELSENYFKKYEAYHEAEGNKKQIAAVNLARSYNFSNAGNYEESARAITKALGLYEELQDTVYVVIALNKLGYLMSEIGNFDEAHKYLNKAIPISEELGIKSEELFTLNTKAVIFDKENELDSALIYYTRAYKLGGYIEDANDRFYSQYNMSVIHRKRRELDSAVFYGQQALDQAKILSIPYISMDAKTLMIALRTSQGNNLEALKIYESVSEKELEAMGLGNKEDYYYHGARAYKANGNYLKSLQSFEKYLAYKDSLTSLNTRSKINEIEIAYQTEKKERQIELLDLKNKNAELLISQKNRTILIGAIALGFISILAVVLYVLIRKYFRQKQALAKALDEKNLLLKEIHHRVKNNLQLVSSLLTLQGQSITDDEALKAINEGKNRVRSMALIHQDLYQTENITDVNAETYLLKLCNELFDTYNINTSDIVLQTDIEALNVDVDTLIPLGLILNELITNALKYAFEPQQKGLISIQLKEVDKALQLVVADNGKGYDLNEVNPLSFGNKLVSSLIQQLDGDMTVTNTEGTRIHMAFKSYKISRTNS